MDKTLTRSFHLVSASEDPALPPATADAAAAVALPCPAAAVGVRARLDLAQQLVEELPVHGAVGEALEVPALQHGHHEGHEAVEAVGPDAALGADRLLDGGAEAIAQTFEEVTFKV